MFPVQRATELFRDRGLVHVLPVSLTPRAQTWDFGWQASPALWIRVAYHARLDMFAVFEDNVISTDVPVFWRVQCRGCSCFSLGLHFGSMITVVLFRLR